MHSFNSNGVALHVRDEGPRDGRVIMFSNSLGTDLRVWDLLIPLLSENLRVVRYDKRGHGLSVGGLIGQNMLVRTPLAGYLGTSAAIAASDMTSSTSELTLPVLALVGEHDGATNPDLVRGTAELCGADFHIIANAGHLPCVEQPQQTANHINEFLVKTE